MDQQQSDIEGILSLAANGGRIAVVGVSDNPSRPSNEVASYLLRQGFNVVPVNPKFDSVFGMKCWPDLRSLPERADIVDVFRRSEEAGAVVDEAIATGARAVWLQEGVIDEAAATRARDAGLVVVMDRCMLKEHSRRKVRPPGP